MTFGLGEPETTRRKLNLQYDSDVSNMHRVNYRIAKPYISNKKILDIGCWTGQFESLLSKTKCKVVAIDPSIEAIRYAKLKYPHMKFLNGTAGALPFERDSFDVVTFLDVLEHVPKHTEVVCLSEIHRVLKKNGILILSTNFNSIVSILLDPAYFLIGHRHYSLENLKSFLDKSGFKIIKVRTSGGIFHLLTHIFELLAKHILNKKVSFPEFIKTVVKNEHYRTEGFVSIHVVAKKG